MREHLKLWIFFLLIILAIRFIIFFQSTDSFVNGEGISFRQTLFTEPQVFSSYQLINARPSGFSPVKIIAPLEPKFHYGDTIAVSGIIGKKEPKNFGSFKNKLIINKKPDIIMYFPKIEAVGKSRLAFVYLIRQKIISLFGSVLPADSSALLLGIVFGIKGNMSKEFLDNIRTVGVMHVIAASGMNVSMAGGFLSSFFALFLRRQIALGLTVIAVLFYALLAGLEPSIMRASIMGIMAFSAQILGRQRLAGYSLFMAGWLMLFVSPDLFLDVGFQLSFLATLGLLYIRPFMERGTGEKLIKSSVVGQEAAATICAQIATLPILLANFGTYSLWSVAANAVLLWTIPILMTLGGLAVVFGSLISFLAQPFLYLAFPLLIYFEHVSRFFASLPGKITAVDFPITFGLGYYLVLLSLILLLRSWRRE
ncbi:ComEC/Rec2 family competence protein [Patescibacteria group bacterium]|nr:ComEC/Rec2 family competence protein [Patescibacteria group bacterium]MCL5010402.1 ComEC/Rec2 family competence protein [Patescibacteria group bacterium]